MQYVYTGTDTRHYPSYRDALSRRTLTVAPGGTYSIEVASGQPEGLPVPPGDGRWIPAEEPAPGGVFEAPAHPSVPASPVPPADPPAVNDPAAAPAADKE